jgi:hypothetical protein
MFVQVSLNDFDEVTRPSTEVFVDSTGNSRNVAEQRSGAFLTSRPTDK